MSTRRIIIGLLIGGCLLALGLTAVRFLGLPAPIVLIGLLVVPGVYVSSFARIHRSRSLRPYWERACMGIRWRRRFPDSPKSEIREFLRIFVDAFLFPQAWRSRFSPDDRLLDVYRTLHPPDHFSPDDLELEILAVRLQKQYTIDLQELWREDITLGEL